MDNILELFATIDSHLGGSQWFVMFLLLTGLFFTVYLRFPQIRFFKHAFSVLMGGHDKKGSQGDTTHFQSLSTALSGTIGTGNIAGVALAIHLGGPSALFWMLMTALLGMTTKLVEVSLSHKYREKADDGTFSGGPMYYMKNGLKMKWLAAVFAFATILSSFGVGSLPQVNSIATSMFAVFSVPQWITGAILTVVLIIIIFGGVKRIFQVAERLTPLMAVVYILAGIMVLVYNYENIIPSFISIFSNLFSDTAATGGFLGAGFAWAFNRGVNRGLFSNEAGQGSAPIAHAAAKTDEPVSEGAVALLEPFIDTVIICMLTGMVILSSGVWNEKFDNKFQASDMIVLSGIYDETIEEHKNEISNYVLAKSSSAEPFVGMLNIVDGQFTDEITLIHNRSFAEDVVISDDEGNSYSGQIKVKEGKIIDSRLLSGDLIVKGKSLIHSAPLSVLAFERSFFGVFGSYIVPICLLLFAFSTTIAWYYYASRAVIHLWGTKRLVIFRVIYVVTFFFASFIDTTFIWVVSGITVAMMTLPNLIGILMLRKEVKQMVDEYWIKIKSK